MRKLFVLTLALLASPSIAWGQGATPGARLEALSKRVNALGKLQADVPALLEAVRSLQQQVSALKRELASRKTMTRGYKALRAQLVGLDDRLGDLELRIAAVALRAGQVGGGGCEDSLCMRAFGGKLKLAVRGLLHAEYEGVIASERRTLAGGRVGDHGSGFALARARLFADAEVFDPRLRLQIGLEAGDRAQRLLLDALVGFRWHRMLNVRAGLQRVPFGRQYALELPTMLFRDRSPVTEAFYPGRDIGLLIHGQLLDSSRFGRLSYQAGVFNGAGPRGGEFKDDNTDFLYAARLTYEPLGPLAPMESDAAISKRPRIAIGGSVFYNLVETDAAERAGETDPARIGQLRDQDGDGEVDNVGVLGLNAELAMRWRGITWQNELFYRYEDPGAVADSRSFWGVYSQIGVAHREGFEIAARYGFWELSRYGDDGTAVEPARTHEAALALGAWLFSRHLRLQTAYAHRWLRGLETRSGGPLAQQTLREHRVYVQTQLYF
jgi:hypothetical protein